METLASRLQKRLAEQGLTQEKLANMVGISQNAISLIIKGQTQKPRFATDIAKALDVDVNWLLNGHTSETVKSPLHNIYTHRIDLLDVEAAAHSSGIINPDYPDIIQSIGFSDEGLREVVGCASAHGINLIKVPTDSMSPTINPKDVVFINTNIRQYIGEGIYAFKLNGETYIKRLQRLPTGVIRAISDNSLYPPFDITEELFDTAEIIGKFIRVLPVNVREL